MRTSLGGIAGGVLGLAAVALCAAALASNAWYKTGNTKIGLNGLSEGSTKTSWAQCGDFCKDLKEGGTLALALGIAGIVVAFIGLLAAGVVVMPARIRIVGAVPCGSPRAALVAGGVAIVASALFAATFAGYMSKVKSTLDKVNPKPTMDIGLILVIVALCLEFAAAVVLFVFAFITGGTEGGMPIAPPSAVHPQQPAGGAMHIGKPNQPKPIAAAVNDTAAAKPAAANLQKDNNSGESSDNEAAAQSPAKPAAQPAAKPAAAKPAAGAGAGRGRGAGAAPARTASTRAGVPARTGSGVVRR